MTNGQETAKRNNFYSREFERFLLFFDRSHCKDMGVVDIFAEIIKKKEMGQIRSYRTIKKIQKKEGRFQDDFRDIHFLFS